MTYFDDLFATTGKTALVTGGAGGIGRMITMALVRAGTHVIIASRKGQACEEAASEINALGLPGRVSGIEGDVSNEEAIDALVARVGMLTDALHVLVNNAGKTWGAPLAHFPHKAWESVFAVNVAGPFTLTQRLLPHLRKAGNRADPARIINIGSMVGAQPVAEHAYSYAASKAAIHHLTKIMALELAETFITVNAIAPGIFDSRMTAYVMQDEALLAATTANIPMRRLGAEDDIAGLVHLLCGRAGAYMTGTIIALDGGLGILPSAKVFS